MGGGATAREVRSPFRRSAVSAAACQFDDHRDQLFDACRLHQIPIESRASNGGSFVRKGPTGKSNDRDPRAWKLVNLSQQPDAILIGQRDVRKDKSRPRGFTKGQGFFSARRLSDRCPFSFERYLKNLAAVTVVLKHDDRKAGERLRVHD